MDNFISLIILCLIGSFTSYVQSTCLRREVLSRVTKHGNIKQYCAYNGMKISPISSFKVAAPKCLKRKCNGQNLRCCGFSFATGVGASSKGCAAHNDACRLVFINKNDLSEVYLQMKSVNKRKKKRKLSTNRRI